MSNDRFIKPEGIYLLSHSIGLAPAGVRAQADTEFFDIWKKNTPDAWSFWLSSIDRFRAALGALFNSTADNVCPQTNLSSALTKIIYALPRESGRSTILLTEDDFPSIGFVLDRATSQEFELKFIPTQRDASDLATWDEYLTPDVGFALITHVHSNTSLRVPVGEIAALARERGAVSIIDIAQSAGIVPIDVTAWNADFVIGSCVKWLCGGPGAGYLWVNPDIVDRCEPIDVGWFSHADPFEFDIHHFKYAGNAMRFWGGTPSILPFVVARNSIELMRSIGIENIQAHNNKLSGKIASAVDDDALISPRWGDRGGTVVLNLGARQADIAERLATARVHCDSRATGMRLSPHIYNTADEIDAVVGCLKD